MKSFSLYSLISVWLTVCLVLIAWLGGSHALALFPTTIKGEKTKNWALSHILAPGCGCSDYVLKSLLSRKPNSSILETVYWMSDVEPAFSESLVKAGYQFKLLPPSNDKSKIEGVPTLMVFNGGEQPLYAGGYSSQKLNSVNHVKDQEILLGLMGKGPLKEFPIFGCATSLKYRKILNPFALYGESL